jgi:cytoskeletal protein CcmA (bactofilin family)
MTTIGPSAIITGDVSSDEDLFVDGAVRGHIIMRQATLTVGPHAHIDGHIRGVRVEVRGTMQGTILASERVELTHSANVTGDLSANIIVIIEGARFQGRIDMDRRTIAAKVAQYKAARA